MPLLSSLLRDKGGSPLESFEQEQPRVNNAGLDHSLRYFLIFIVLGGAAAVLVSNVLSGFSALPAASGFFNVGLATILLLITMIFQVVMIQSTQFNFLLIVLEGALLPVFFYSHFSSWFAVGTAFFIVIALLGFARARMLLGSTLKVNFWHYSTMMATMAITAFALFLASLYVGLYNQQEGITFNAYKFVVSTATPGLQYAAPNFSPDNKVDSFLDGTIKDYFAKQPDFHTMPSGGQQDAVRQASTGLMSQISEFTKVVLKPGESIASYTFRWVSGLIKTAHEEGYGAVVVLSIFLLIFFAVKGTMFFVKWPVLVVCFMIYLLLQAVGLVSVGTEMRQKELIIVK